MRTSDQMMFLFVLFGGVMFAEDALVQSKVIGKIELLGGKVMRDETLPDHPVVGIDFELSKRFSHKHIHLLKSFKNLKSLNLIGIKISNNDLKELQESFSDTRLIYDNPDEFEAFEQIVRLGGTAKKDDNVPGRP